MLMKSDISPSGVAMTIGGPIAGIALASPMSAVAGSAVAANYGGAFTGMATIGTVGTLPAYQILENLDFSKPGFGLDSNLIANAIITAVSPSHHRVVQLYWCGCCRERCWEQCSYVFLALLPIDPMHLMSVLRNGATDFIAIWHRPLETSRLKLFEGWIRV